MMNAVALFLVLSSLASAGLWSPSRGGEKLVSGGEDHVIVKEGHRVVVVEYDPETGGNTKVLISPQETHVSHQAKEKLSSLVDDAKGKTKETLAAAKDRAKETFDEAKEKGKEATSGRGPVEMVLGKAKEKASEATEKATEKVHEVEEQAEEALGKTKDKLSHKTEEAKEKAKEASSGRGPVEMVCDAYGICKEKVANVMGKAKQKASDVPKESVSEALARTKDKLSHKTNEIKDAVIDKAHQVGGGPKETMDTSKTIGNDVAKNITTEIGEAREKAEIVKEKGERDLEEILTRGRDLTKDIFAYVVSPRLVASAMGVVHLLGFATAYGMSIWVTFVSSYVLAGALPRQQFGMVQSKVYPVYFRVLEYAVMVAMIGHLHGMGKGLLGNRAGMAQACSLLGSFGMVLFNLLYLEPLATKVMFERMKMEKEEGRGQGHDGFLSEETTKQAEDHVTATSSPPAKAPSTREKSKATVSNQMNELGERLKKLNAYSSFLNILTLMALTGHLVYLGQRLHVTC